MNGDEAAVLKQLQENPSLIDTPFERKWQWISLKKLSAQYQVSKSDEDLAELKGKVREILTVVFKVCCSKYIWKRVLPDNNFIRFLLQRFSNERQTGVDSLDALLAKINWINYTVDQLPQLEY